MTTETLNQDIEITPGVSGGKPRIAGCRIAVENIVIWHECLASGTAPCYRTTSVNLGYEISFTRCFHTPQPMRTLEEIRADILALERETERSLWREKDDDGQRL